MSMVRADEHPGQSMSVEQPAKFRGQSMPMVRADEHPGQSMSVEQPAEFRRQSMSMVRADEHPGQSMSFTYLFSAIVSFYANACIFSMLRGIYCFQCS